MILVELGILMEFISNPEGVIRLTAGATGHSLKVSLITQLV